MTREQANAALAKLRDMRSGADGRQRAVLSAARRLIVKLRRHADLYRDWSPLDSLSAYGGGRTVPQGVMARKAGMVLRDIGVLKTKGRADKPVWMQVRLA